MITDRKEPTILIIDDDPNNINIVTEHLAGCPYTILVAEDGESGIARAEYAQPTLLLLDVMMPGIDGYETCRRLKARESTRDIPVIFMTALAETDHKVKGFAAGGVDYITKPFQREEVLARVGVHLRIRELTTTLEQRVEERTLALQQSEKKFRGIFDQTFELLGVLSPDGILLEANRTALDMSGEREADVIGMPLWDTPPWASSPELPAKVRDAVARASAGELVRFEADYQGNGNHHVIDFSLKPVLDDRGNVMLLITEGRDITVMKKLERDLRQSQKMEAIGTLAGGIAHDFNNILTAIIGYTEMAQLKLDNNDAAARDLERAQEASTRAKELVSRILTISRRSEQGRNPLHLTAIIDEVLKLLRSSLPTTIEINRHIATTPNEDQVLADPTQIHQVLMNLGTNAAHAMRDHGGILNISLSCFDVDAAFAAHYPDLKPGPFVRLTVSDTGHGMEPRIKERIFDPYFTTKKIGEGTGMGLAIVHGIIKGHGGGISVYSEPGKGTTFHIFLPKLAGGHDEPAVENGAPGVGTERILFVDDEMMLTELGLEMLETLGYTVTVCPGGCEALTLFRADPLAYDLVITDMTMPGLTGKELAREILSIRPDMPIILCTGFSEHINGQNARDSGIRGYLMKPYTTIGLSRIIRTVLAEVRS